jgi:hypothetical protein
MCTDIDRISVLAKEDPQRQFFSIAHLITPGELYVAFQCLRREASAGIDGVTYAEYEKNAEGNIRELHQRLKDGKYQCQPLRRVYIPKENGKQRPISIPVLTPSTSRIFSIAPMGSDPNEGNTKRWTKWDECCVESSTRTFGLRRAQQGQVRCSQARVRGNRMTTAESRCMAGVESSRKCPRATHREPGFLKWSHGYGRIGTTGCQCPTSSAFETS